MTGAAGLVRAHVGIGANLGDPRVALEQAFVELSTLPDTRLIARSSIYRSASVGAEGPDYLNAVAALDTGLPALVLLRQLMQIESRHGRERSHRNAPRTLDLDLLSWGQLELSTVELTLPHPRAHQRAFVLVPWLEIEPHLELPGLGSLAVCLDAVRDQRIERCPP
jgi:2-amino-4-hydroxy-6-hydroxymethyldihydropteridine diphosphokinase